MEGAAPHCLKGNVELGELVERRVKVFDGHVRGFEV